jgi:dTDP-glucose pyrophosphorylase
VPVDGITEGAACTLMLAKKNIYNDNPLIVANSDQYIEWNSSDFINLMSNDYDGSILIFNATETKWSYVKTEKDYITEVAEKKVISNLATTGIYYFKHGKDCCISIEEMISKDIRTNGEFYIAPCYNELISKGKKIIPYPVKKMMGLGTPEDMEYFINNYARQ